jgi:hypothetical protein
MCWIHKWKYINRDLRTCARCGLHQERERDCDSNSTWGDLTCKEFADCVVEHKEEIKKLREQKRREIIDRTNCKFH